MRRAVYNKVPAMNVKTAVRNAVNLSEHVLTPQVCQLNVSAAAVSHMYPVIGNV